MPNEGKSNRNEAYNETFYIFFSNRKLYFNNGSRHTTDELGYRFLVTVDRLHRDSNAMNQIAYAESFHIFYLPSSGGTRTSYLFRLKRKPRWIYLFFVPLNIQPFRWCQQQIPKMCLVISKYGFCKIKMNENRMRSRQRRRKCPTNKFPFHALPLLANKMNRDLQTLFTDQRFHHQIERNEFRGNWENCYCIRRRCRCV